MHYYYVSYIPTALRGFQLRTAEVCWNAPITTIAEVDEVAALLSRDLNGPVIVVSLALLRIEPIGA